MKYLFLILFLYVSFTSTAQSKRLMYLKANEQPTMAKDSAFLLRSIDIAPNDTGRYNFTETFMTGQLLRAGQTAKPTTIVLAGDCTVFYPNGKRLSYTTYVEKGKKSETIYYPNGKVYMVTEYDYQEPNVYNYNSLIKACNDSAGKSLIVNGNGHFITYHPIIPSKFISPATSRIYQVSNMVDEGDLKEGKNDGTWTGHSTENSMAYTEEFKDGKLIRGKSVDKDGKTYEYNDAVEKSAEFKGGVNNFTSFLGNNIVYPVYARKNNIQGTVFVTFVIGKDGKLGEIKVLRSPMEEMSAETIRILQLSPSWNPGRQHGIPVRQQFTVPIAFSLKEK